MDPNQKPFALVIDDDGQLSSWLGTVLSHRGYRVLSTQTAEQGVSTLKSAPFAVAFIDIFMPGKGGLYAIEAIQAQAPEIQIIAMSAGHSTLKGNEALRAASKLGATFTLKKPLSVDSVHAILNEINLT